MTNKERKDYLFTQAEEAFGLMMGSYEKRDWKRPIERYRALDLLECLLKDS